MASAIPTPMIYPPERAVEHAVATGARPHRLFDVLWPLWEVEAAADVLNDSSYDLIDRFVVRAALQVGLATEIEIADFLGLDRDLVGRCLQFLRAIGHIDPAPDGEPIRFTALGHRAAVDNKRYQITEERKLLLVDQMTSEPLPRLYYERSCRRSAVPELAPGEAFGRTFRPLAATTSFRAGAIEALIGRSDRRERNVPLQVQALRCLRWSNSYLPMYVIETNGGLLVYTAARAEDDAFFGPIARSHEGLEVVIKNTEGVDEHQMWMTWLADEAPRGGRLEQLPSSLWRATFPADAFAARRGSAAGRRRFAFSRLGSFQFKHNHFLQIWCDDPDVRRSAVTTRLVAMVGSGAFPAADLDGRAGELARHLEVEPPTVSDVLRWATDHAPDVARLLDQDGQLSDGP